MGQKTHPRGFRLGITSDWKSHWFDEDSEGYSDKVLEDRKIRKFVRKNVGRAGIQGVEIERSLGKLKIVIRVARPGMVIGRGGSRIELLRDGLEGICGSKPEISVEEVKNPALSASLIAENVVRQIEQRRSPTRAAASEVEKAMHKGAKGVKVQLKGRLRGSQYARKNVVTKGSVPLQTIRANIDYALEEAHTKYGKIGVKVWVYIGEEEI